MMNRFLLSAIALAALAATPATAADLSLPYQRPLPRPLFFSWTGCYVGGNGGGLWVDRTFTDRLVGDPFFTQSFNQNTSTWTGGLQGGCNYQFAGVWVVGIQGDYNWSGNGSNANNAFFFNNVTGGFITKNLPSVTGRIRFSADPLPIYCTGRAAWERDAVSINFPTGAVANLSSNTRSGWTVGIGGEYAFLNWLTGFIEYDYYGFGSGTDSFACGAVACVAGLGNTFPVDRKEWKSVFKVG